MCIFSSYSNDDGADMRGDGVASELLSKEGDASGEGYRCCQEVGAGDAAARRLCGG
jgi:hypothetical protein